jgi:hypothetical protein
MFLETKTMCHAASSDDSRQQTELNEDGIANTNEGETSQGEGVLIVVPEEQSAEQNTNAVDRASQGEALVVVHDEKPTKQNVNTDRRGQGRCYE